MATQGKALRARTGKSQLPLTLPWTVAASRPIGDNAFPQAAISPSSILSLTSSCTCR